jgi:hypothetical protein
VLGPYVQGFAPCQVSVLAKWSDVQGFWRLEWLNWAFLCIEGEDLVIISLVKVHEFDLSANSGQCTSRFHLSQESELLSWDQTFNDFVRVIDMCVLIINNIPLCT